MPMWPMTSRGSPQNDDLLAQVAKTQAAIAMLMCSAVTRGELDDLEHLWVELSFLKAGAQAPKE